MQFVQCWNVWFGNREEGTPAFIMKQVNVWFWVRPTRLRNIFAKASEILAIVELNQKTLCASKLSKHAHSNRCLSNILRTSKRINLYFHSNQYCDCNCESNYSWLRLQLVMTVTIFSCDYFGVSERDVDQIQNMLSTKYNISMLVPPFQS